MTFIRRSAVPFLWPLALAACGAAPSPHVTVDGDVGELRRAFNAETGKVRAIFLASPT